MASDEDRVRHDAPALLASIRANECDEDELMSYLSNLCAAVRADERAKVLQEGYDAADEPSGSGGLGQ